MHVVVLGAYGSAGVAAAQRLADHENVELTLIDGGEPGGGLCILRGCMPSKEVLSAGAHRFQARHDDRVVTDSLPEVDLERVVARKNEHTSNFAAHRRAAVHELAERDGIEFIHENARFVDNRTIGVGDRQFTPDYVVLATGSVVDIPDLPGIEDVPVRTSADVLDATEFGETGIVMGFGYVGLELAPYLSEAADMNITVIEHDDRPLDEADPDFGDRIVPLYEEQFDIDIRRRTTEQRVEATESGGVRLHAETDAGEHESIEADELFCFTGRRPALDGLGIENTALDPEGEWVDDTMQARDDSRVFAVGDVNGKEPILHVAKEQGFQAASNIRAHDQGETLEPYENTHHHVMFTGLGVYPFARVGHSIASAEAAGLEFVSATREAADDGVFKTKDVPEGLASLVVGTDGTVLGYQGLHFHADAMAKTMQVIIECGLDVREVPDRAYHPTTPEVLDGLFRETAAQLE